MKPFCENKNRSIALRAQRCILNIAFVAAATIASGFHFRATGKGQSASPTSEPHNNISEMTSDTEQGRYDEAVQLGLAILRNDPSDEFVYQQIADVYLIRAQKDRERREQWVTKAVSYVEKSLSLNSKDKDVAGVHLFMDALSFESAGDLSVEKRCIYYDRARRLLEDRVSLLKVDQITLAGRTFPVEPLRKENDKVLARVKDKAMRAPCKSTDQ
jgi:tetratricopeptide (TPR) repeat protein